MELKSCFTPNDVREALRTLPKTLEETYDKIFDSIPKRNQPYVRAALQWIACSARPLSLDELAVAAVTNPAKVKPNGPENQLIGGGKTIHKMLSKLIDVQELDRNCFEDILLRWSSKNSNIVKFSHSSVRDYLLQRHDDTDVSRPFSFSEDMAHRFIAKSCLAFMPETANTVDEAYGMGPVCNQMDNYLTNHWHTHAARLPDEEPGSLAHLFNEVPLAVRFFMMAEADLLGVWRSRTEPPSPEEKLQYAACRSSSRLTNIVLASYPDLDIDASTKDGSTALSFACERRHWQIADTLLKRGADPNQHSEMIAPLVAASRHGADDIVQKLISHGADVNVRCDPVCDCTPLVDAIAAGHPSTVELLLINGADPDIWKINNMHCVRAADRGVHECIDLLLRHRVALETECIDPPSPLEYAAASGSVKTVKMLLAQGLDVDDDKFLLPLHADEMLPASIYRLKYPIVDIHQPPTHRNCLCKSYGSPMHAAAYYGHTEVIKLLVENNAAVNEQSHYWETPSTLAKLRGHKETLEYLISKGGEVMETEVCYRQDLFKAFGEALEQTEVLHRQDSFKSFWERMEKNTDFYYRQGFSKNPGDPNEALKFCGISDDDDAASDDNDAIENMREGIGSQSHPTN